MLKTEFQQQAARNTQIQTSQTRQRKDSVEISVPSRRSPKRVKDRDELFAEFGQAFAEKFTTNDQGEIAREADKQAGEKDSRPYLAALSYRRGMEELRQTHPGLSRRELRQASQEDPELSKTLSVVDKAGYSPLGWARTAKRNSYGDVGGYLEAKGAKDIRPPEKDSKKKK